MNQFVLDPISKLLEMESNSPTRQLKDLESKKEFLQDFKSFLKNSDEGSLLIDRFKLKKIKNDLNTKHQSILEESKPTYIPNENPHLNRNIEYLSINNAYKLNAEDYNKKLTQATHSLKSGSISATPQNKLFVICNKNSKNIKNLKLFEEIKKQETKNEFHEAINIINTNNYLNTITKANTTKSIGVKTNSDFYYSNKNNNNIYISNRNELINKAGNVNSNERDEDDVFKKTVEEVIRKEEKRQNKKNKIDKNINNVKPREIFNHIEEHNKKNDGYNFHRNNNNNLQLLKNSNKKGRKKLNQDIENILTIEIVQSIQNQEEEEKTNTGNYSSNLLSEEKDLFKEKTNSVKNANKKALGQKEKIASQTVKSPAIKNSQRLKTSPKIPFNTEGNSDSEIYRSSNGENILTNARNENTNFSKEKANRIKSSKRTSLVFTESDAKAFNLEFHEKDKVEFERIKSSLIKKFLRNKKEKRNNQNTNANYANENLHSETNQMPNKILDFNNVFLPNIARKKPMIFRGNEVMKGNIKNLSETFIDNFKVKSKERIKKNNHKLFFMNLDEKQFC